MPTMTNKRGEKGNEVIEFVFVVLVLIPLLMYVVVIGTDLARSVEVAQVARDAGSMYVRGIDFSQSGNQQELARLAQDLGMAIPGTGSGAVQLSKVTYIASGGCTMPCNQAQYVLVQRFIIGDTSTGGVFPSNSFVQLAGSPTIDSSGNVLNYMTDSTAVVSGVSTKLTLTSGEYAYIAEAYFPSPLANNFPGFSANSANYSYTIF